MITINATLIVIGIVFAIGIGIVIGYTIPKNTSLRLTQPTTLTHLQEAYIVENSNVQHTISVFIENDGNIPYWKKQDVSRLLTAEYTRPHIGLYINRKYFIFNLKS